MGTRTRDGVDNRRLVERLFQNDCIRLYQPDFQRVAGGKEVPHPPKHHESKPKKSQPAKLLKGRVIIIEDDPEVRDLLQQLVREEGLYVYYAHGGVAALALVERVKLKPDLILSDYNLPGGMNGAEATAKLRQQIKLPVPVITLTGRKSTDAVGYYDREGEWIDGATSGYYDSQGRWIARQPNGNNAQDMGMPREIRARMIWLDSFIRAASRDGTLNRARTNRALRDLNAIRRSERALPRNRDGMLSVRNEAAINLRLDRLSDQLRVMFSPNDRRY